MHVLHEQTPHRKHMLKKQNEKNEHKQNTHTHIVTIWNNERNWDSHIHKQETCFEHVSFSSKTYACQETVRKPSVLDRQDVK